MAMWRKRLLTGILDATRFLRDNASIERRLRNLASLRGEEPEETTRFLARSVLRRVPQRIKPVYLELEGLEVAESGIEEHLPYLRLANGRVFYGLPQDLRHSRIYDVLADRLPRSLHPQCLRLALDVWIRYVNFHCTGMPVGGSVVLEIGAYHGLKAIKFLDVLANGGRVFAAELVPHNVEILEHNIRANGIEDRMVSLPVGVWSEPGTRTILGAGYQRHSLVDLDGQDFSRHGEVRVETLDRIIAEHGLDLVDFVNVQVNGAEVEVLAGLDEQRERVKVVRVVSGYEVDGKRQLDECIDLLERRGFVPMARSKGSVVAIQERYRHEWSQRQGSRAETSDAGAG